ncbi:TetR/AcrR family transcriptional regulator [Mycolicibacterium smegmatis]|uniref:TetR/AcrR family transcriptional regulator n=1 Tax=Mycolicibacterium smegmatis TaxID=1772 RepID=UPI001E51A713|nr:TetR/AcrR family transcriptional regulator [Mycolicibacterium smegmatis]UGU33126.1 TetR/AcrR family transcriptional regulator [Mycolicibacterium smegmatis]ULN68004.1 TetR/AcrR family transcriptional regulator [Mycolicibacterium smegmatis]
MPKVVDHDERRREVLDATWRVIGSEGLEALTLRRIAQEAGCSNGVLAHYFRNKEDILVSAHQLAFARARKRIVEATDGVGGITALRLAILEALPLDAERLLEAQVDVSFLGQAVGNPYLREIRSASNADSRALWAQFVVDAQRRGDIRTDEDTQIIVDEILAVVESLSVEAIINPGRMTPDHQVYLVDRLLARLQ